MRRGIEGLALGFAGPPIPRWGAQHDSSPASILHGWGVTQGPIHATFFTQ